MSLRFLITILCLHSAISLSADYNISKKVESALQLMLEGNTEESINNLKKAAGTNDMVAQYYLGQCYELGIGVDVDPSQAFSMYRRAAERGFPPAMIELSRCYKEGIGVSYNGSRADEWQSRYEKKYITGTLPRIKDLYAESSNHPIDTRVSEENKPIAANSNLPIVSENKFDRPNERPAITNEKVTTVPSGTSDVDDHIPITDKVADNVFALIIANENYQDVASVANALNDGDIMAEYCRKTLGIPSTNIHLIKDATLNNLKREINLFKQIADAYNGEASFIVYYAGHGIPDEKTHNAYIMPVDGFSSDLSTCFSLSELYKTFGEMPTQKNIIIMDACFSGSTRGSEMLYSARAIKLKPKQVAPTGKTIVLSSAQGDETAYPYDEQRHGLFTYFLLKKLKETQGNITLGELFDYVKENVAKKSLVINKKSQTPVATPANEITQEWYNWKIKL